MNARGRPFWAGLVVGWAVIAYGLIGLWDNARDTRPDDLVRWFLGGAVVHDGLVAPFVCLVGLVLARAVPARVRGPVTGGLIVSGAVTLFAWPFLRGYGVRADDPSALPNDYAAGLVVVLGAVWAVCGLIAVRAARRPGPPRPEAHR